MDYIEKNLLKDEKVIMRAKISWLYLLPSLIVAAIVIVVGFLVKKYAFDDVLSSAGINARETEFNAGTIILIICAIYGGFQVFKAVLTMVTTKLAITNKRVLGKTGVFKIQAMDIKIEKIDNVMISSGFAGRIFRYQNLVVKSTSGVYSYHAIGNADEFKNVLTEAIDAHAEELQRAQASAIASAMSIKNP